MLFIFFLYLVPNISHSPHSIANNSEFNLDMNLKRDIKFFDHIGNIDDLKSIITSSTKNTSINSINASYQQNNIINAHVNNPLRNYEQNPLYKKTLKERLKNSAKLLNLENFSV